MLDLQDNNDGIVCDICPHKCFLSEGATGLCHVLRNESGRIVNPLSGRCSTISVEPIEKRPLFHFLPGCNFLSVGFFGCQLHCEMCENFSVSQEVEGRFSSQSPDDLVEMATNKKTAGITFTYNEPTLYYEYIIEVAQKTRVVVKTNGFVNPHILREMSDVQAWNVDIKGDDKEYHRVCGGSLSPVMAAVETLAESKTHLELSYLVLPRLVRDVNQHLRIRDWIAEISPTIPVHILYCFPVHRMEEFYEQSWLLPIYDLFSAKLEYVYISNVYGTIQRRNTFCSICDALLIERSPKAKIHRTSCCGTNLQGIWANSEV